MGSHKGKGTYRLYVPSPMRFRKRASEYNICVGKEMKGKRGSRAQIRAAFQSAANTCRGRALTYSHRGPRSASGKQINNLF